MSRRFLLGCSAAILLVPFAARGQCVGDCNLDGGVTINELVLAVNIALGNEPLADCEAIDRNDDGEAFIGEIIEAVSAALCGCPGCVSPTPGPTPTATPGAGEDIGTAALGSAVVARL